MDANYAALAASLYAAWQRRREAGEDREDALVDAILPEVAKYFASLFKEGDVDGIFASLNKLILGVYAFAPDALQFIIRLLANLGVEKMQGKWPAWASLPVMVFVKGYFNALEEATRGKPKPTTDDVKDALNDAARKAKDVASDLGKKFKAARDAAPHINIPPNYKPEEGDMSDHPTPPTGPAAGGTGKKSFEERFNEAKVAFATIGASLGLIADRTEDHAQSFANGLFPALGMLFATIATTMLCAFLDNDRFMVVNVVWWSAVWILGPFVATHEWRGRNRRIHAKEMTKKPEAGRNLYEQAGNGWLELGALIGSFAVVILPSMLVIALMCAVASYTNFASAYVWCGLIAVGVTFFGCIFLDVGLDTLRAIGQLALPKELEGEALKARQRVARSFSLVGVIYGVLLLGPVLYYAFVKNEYGASSYILGLYLALVAGFANTRLGSEPGTQAPENVREIWVTFLRRNFKSAQQMILLSAAIIAANVMLDHVFLPPTCPNPGESAEDCSAELPSYAERWQESSPYKLLGAMGTWSGAKADMITASIVKDAAAGNGTTDGNDGNVAPASACSAQINAFVNGIKKDDCKVIFESSKETKAIEACRRAVTCGALNENGVKMPISRSSHSTSSTDTSAFSFGNWWCVAGGAIMIFVIVMFVVGSRKPGEKKDDAKPKTH